MYAGNGPLPLVAGRGATAGLVNRVEDIRSPCMEALCIRFMSGGAAFN